ncbi:hypothetical protein PoB_000984100, partial [Plakobranchus ocellatus]
MRRRRRRMRRRMRRRRKRRRRRRRKKKKKKDEEEKEEERASKTSKTIRVCRDLLNLFDPADVTPPAPSPQQGDLRLSGPPSGLGAGSGARTRDRRVPADLRADSQATVPPTPPLSFVTALKKIYEKRRKR